MRPSTLAEAYERLLAGPASEKQQAETDSMSDGAVGPDVNPEPAPDLEVEASQEDGRITQPRLKAEPFDVVVEGQGALKNTSLISALFSKDR